MNQNRSARRWPWVVAATLLAAGMAWLLLGTLSTVVASDPYHPAVSRAAALALADSMRAAEARGTSSACHARLLVSPDTTGRAPVIVLLHGFTNCPKQFDGLARVFARRGCSVVVPLLPRHGMADRMTTELARLNGEDLVTAGEEAVDIAHGLGRPIVVVGLSSSAVLAGWLAEHRDDVDGAVLLAPALGPHGMPPPVARRMTGALLALPNFYVWWDSKLQTNIPGPKQCYPRFASHAIAQVYRLGMAVMADALHAKPKAKRIVLVTTETDEAVNNDLALELARRWRARGADVTTYQFPAALGVRHDMIDPEQPYARTDVSYPVIEKMVASAAMP
jgi:alpha-beta hydrolase superfamily lysophospholipase